MVAHCFISSICVQQTLACCFATVSCISGVSPPALTSCVIHDIVMFAKSDGILQADDSLLCGLCVNFGCTYCPFMELVAICNTLHYNVPEGAVHVWLHVTSEHDSRHCFNIVDNL